MYTEKFATKKGEFRWSVELLPPGLGKTVHHLISKAKLDELLVYKPIGIDVTYHQEKMVYRKTPGTNNSEIQTVYPQYKNPGTIAVCSYLAGRYKEKYGIEIIPHLICGGFSIKECEEALIDCYTAGLHTVLALQGDPQDRERGFQPHSQGHTYASELVEQITSLNNGQYLYPIETPVKTSFCVGVGGYPEKHYEAPNAEHDMHYLKQKVDKGAHYIVTQMFFDNQAYFSFVTKAKEAGITVPIVPGLKLLDKKNQLTILPRLFHLDFPQDLVKEVLAHDDSCTKTIGLEWTIAQCQELLAQGVPLLHFYSMNKGDQIIEVIKRFV